MEVIKQIMLLHNEKSIISIVETIIHNVLYVHKNDLDKPQFRFKLIKDKNT